MRLGNQTLVAMVKGILQTKKQIQVGRLEVTGFLHIFQTRIKTTSSTLKAPLTSQTLLRLKHEGFTVQLV